jgi:hypothetical protein
MHAVTLLLLFVLHFHSSAKTSWQHLYMVYCDGVWLHLRWNVQGLFGVARRFYLLFQQHTTPALAAKSDEWLDGAEGYHSVRYMGPKVALVCIDMRTRRTKKEILPQVRHACFAMYYQAKMQGGETNNR